MGHYSKDCSKPKPSNGGSKVIALTANILVYNNFMEKHVEHLQMVFQRLKKNKLYVKFKKCELKVMEMDFFGHKITQKGLKMNDHKVKAILD
jgi:cleavage and polyadenylation specificity factor subunit 1